MEPHERLRESETSMASGNGTREDPWVLTTPSGGSEYSMFRDESLDPPALVCRVGKTELRYHLSAIEDLHAMLKTHGDWMLLGSADEQKPAADGTIEAWARSDPKWSASRATTACGRFRPLDCLVKQSVQRHNTSDNMHRVVDYGPVCWADEVAPQRK
jgi:hypothetical protein